MAYKGFLGGSWFRDIRPQVSGTRSLRVFSTASPIDENVSWMTLIFIIQIQNKWSDYCTSFFLFQKWFYILATYYGISYDNSDCRNGFCQPWTWIIIICLGQCLSKLSCWVVYSAVLLILFLALPLCL